MSKALVDSATLGLFARHAITHPLDFAASVGPTLNEATFGLLGSSFDPQRDIEDLSGKVILVTGGTRPAVPVPFLSPTSLDVLVVGC